MFSVNYLCLIKYSRTSNDRPPLLQSKSSLTGGPFGGLKIPKFAQKLFCSKCPQHYQNVTNLHVWGVKKCQFGESKVPKFVKTIVSPNALKSHLRVSYDHNLHIYIEDDMK